MAGGPWTSVTIGQGRPGLFINFVPFALAAISPGTTGVVATIVKAPWGPDKVVQEVDNEVDLLNYYTNGDTSPFNAYYEGHHAFLGGARALMMYRIEGVGAAKATHNFVDTTAVTPVAVIRVDGKYNGVYGNGFSVALQVNPVIATATDVLLYRGALLLKTYTTSIVARGSVGHIAEIVSLINSDPGNYSIFATLLVEGNSTPASVAIPGVALAGGSDGSAPVAADYTIALAALEATSFNVFHADVLDVEIAGIGATLRAWINNMRGYGKYVAMVTGSGAAESLSQAIINAAASNNPAVVYWYPGVFELNSLGNRILNRGSAYAATIAGMYSALPPGEDLTYTILPNVLDLEFRLNNSQVMSGIAGGLMLGTFDGQQYKIEEAINTLVTLGANQGDAWQDVQSINTMDAIATGITISANSNFIGKVPNDGVGQVALINAVRDFLTTMANSRAIATDFEVGLDSTRASVGKNVFLVVAIRPIQSMKFIYFTVVVG
jgi:hypothetical protein